MLSESSTKACVIYLQQGIGDIPNTILKSYVTFFVIKIARLKTGIFKEFKMIRNI